MEVGYRLLNVALYVSCKDNYHFLVGRWKCYGVFHPKTKLILLFYKKLIAK